MWVMSKLNNSETNPSIVILEHLTGQIQDLRNEPQNTIQLCERINVIKGFDELTEEEIEEIQIYGIETMEANKSSKIWTLAKTYGLSWLNRIGYILGAISIGVGGFSWWIVGFAIGTWWANGAARMAAQKQDIQPGPSWEMPVHLVIHFIMLCGLISFSIYNFN